MAAEVRFQTVVLLITFVLWDIEVFQISPLLLARNRYRAFLKSGLFDKLFHRHLEVVPLLVNFAWTNKQWKKFDN